MVKVALCLCGLSGNFLNYGNGPLLNNNFAYNHYRKHIIETNKNVDIFIHSWSVNSKNDLIKLYQPTDKLFENQEYFNRDNDYIENNKEIFNVESRVNSILRCLKLVKNNEIKNNFKYDYVIVSRFDIAILSDILFEKLPKDRFIISHWNDRGQRNNHKKGIYDLWFIGNTDILYNYFLTCNKNFNLSKSAHSFWKLIIIKLKINPKYFLYVGEDYELIRRFYYNGHGYNNTYTNINKNLNNYYLKYAI